LTAGLSDEEHGYAVHMIYFQVVLALLVDALVWHTVPDIASCLGALLVVMALYVTQTYQHREEDLADIEMASRL
jgi:drug/metabolite transporter (DMT)-like permease